MEELLQNLDQATNPDPATQNRLAEFINLQFQNPNFGNIIFEILTNPAFNENKTILTLCCNILKSWAKIQLPNMNFDEKKVFFQTLKTLILNNHPAIEDLSIIFVDSVMNGDANTKYFETDIFDFFNKITQGTPMHQICALINIVFYISKHYKRASRYEACEPSLLFVRVNNVIIPFFKDYSMLETPEGCYILIKSLSIYKHLFHRVKAGIQQANELINFSQNIILMFSQRNIILCSDFGLKLVGQCCRFLNSFYSKFKKTFTENADMVLNILNVYLSVLAISLEISRNEAFLISSILRGIEIFRKYLISNHQTLMLILEASKLTEIDQEEYFHSPNIFYCNVYSNSGFASSNSAAHISRSLIFSMIKQNPALFQDLILMPIEEHIVRCTGYCIDALPDKDYSNDINIFEYSSSLFINNINVSPLLIVSHLDFIRHFIRFLSFEIKQQIMESIIIKFLCYESDLLIQFFACKLFKTLMKNEVPPFENSIVVLVNFLPRCFSPLALNSVRILFDLQRDPVLPYAEKVLYSIFEILQQSIAQYLGSTDAIQIENASNIISSNLTLIGDIISSLGNILIPSDLLLIASTIFENGITDCCDDLVVFLTSIFSTSSPDIYPFVQLWLNKAILPTWIGFLDALIEPFFSLISHSPELFVNFNITYQIEEICLEKLINYNTSSDSLYKYSTILSWIIIIDPNADAIAPLECSQYILSQGLCNIQVSADLFDIIASLTISRKSEPPNHQLIDNIIIAVNQNCFLKLYQKRLYSLFFLTLTALGKGENFVLNAFSILKEEHNQRKLGSLNYLSQISYPLEFENSIFDINDKLISPIERINIKELIVSALNACSQNTISLIKNQYSDLFALLIQ